VCTNGFLSPSGAKPTHRTHRQVPVQLVSGSLGYPLELGKPLDQATSSAILEELKRTVPRWRGSQEPSRVLWIGRLPTDIFRQLPPISGAGMVVSLKSAHVRDRDRVPGFD
jgi:hypothetical protein